MNIVAKLCSVWRSSSALTRPTRLLERNATGVRCRGSKRRSYFAFRMSMRELLTQQLHCRHGHMIGIDDLLMQDGMAADYEEIYRVTRQIYEIVRQAQKISVTTSLGTEVVATFSPTVKWIPCDGRYWEQGRWGNLPEGETFTCPQSGGRPDRCRRDGRLVHREVRLAVTAGAPGCQRRSTGLR